MQSAEVCISGVDRSITIVHSTGTCSSGDIRNVDRNVIRRILVPIQIQGQGSLINQTHIGIAEWEDGIIQKDFYTNTIPLVPASYVVLVHHMTITTTDMPSNVKLSCFLLAIALLLPSGSCEMKYNLGFWDFSNWFNFNKKNEQDSSSTSLAGTRCVGCSNKLDDDTTAEDELTILRIEYIKQQILKKLRLKEKPTVSLPINGLPKPVTENEHLFPRNQDATNENDHYYGKTTQAIIFPTEGKF